MMEAEWLACADPVPMLRFLWGVARIDQDMVTERRYRLFSIACCRTAEDRLTPHGLQGVRMLERFVDGFSTKSELNEARMAIEPVTGQGYSVPYAATLCLSDSLYPYQIAEGVVKNVLAAGGRQESFAQLIRDIFGNPFRPNSADPSWLTSTVTQLAEGIYQERAFDRMPILADALQDAGCDNEDILNHCRDENQVHVRGCWVVDAILGKS